MKTYKGIQFLIANNVTWWRIASLELKDPVSYKVLNVRFLKNQGTLS